MGENDYKIIKLLGAGSYGSVYLAKKKKVIEMNLIMWPLKNSSCAINKHI